MVIMGRVASAYGIRGWIKVQPFTEYLDSLLDYPAWWIGLSTCIALEAGALLLTPTPLGQPVSHALAAIGRTFGFLY